MITKFGLISTEENTRGVSEVCLEERLHPRGM
jgi:hypothetical protein